MNNNDERSIVSVDADRVNGGYRAQGNNVASVLNSNNRSTVKINSLSIKLGIVKEKNDAEKCRHFSIRGYVAGMRERGNSNLLPFTEELPPMDIPNFRYWLCQRCLQNNGTTNASHETPLISACDQCLFLPCARSCPPAVLLPFGEGTSGVKSVGGKNDDESESVGVIVAPDKSQLSQEIPDKVKVIQEIPKFCSSETNVTAISKKLESNDLKTHEELQKTKETVTGPVSQPIESGQQDEYPNGHPKRKARKVRLLKELLCGNTVVQQHKKENSSLLPSSSQIKRKIPHDHDHNHARDHDHEHVRDHVHDQRPVDGKKMKTLKGNAIAKNNVPEHSSEPVAREIGETGNKFQWNKHGTQRSSIHGKIGSDAMTAWKSIFSDMGKTDNQVIKSNYGVSKGRGTEPYSNFMVPPKPDKKFNSSKKIASNNPLKSKFFGESSKKISSNNRQSDTELGLGLSLNYDLHTHVRSQPSILNRTHSQDHGRKPGFFLGESSNFEGSVHDVSNRHVPRTTVIQEQRPYTQVSYGGCSGHQKLDFSDPHKRNNGVRGYSAHNHQNHNHQRQENMFSIGRSDEREIIELMAKNQYERNLCESRTHFSPIGNNNGLIPNATGFRKVGMSEGMTSSHHHEYLNMIRPTSENVGPTSMRNPGFTMFDGLTHSQKQPTSGVWISDSGSQRHYDSRYHHLPKANNKMAHNHIYNPTNMQVLEAFNKYNNGSHPNEVVNNRMSFGQPYTKYSEKDKGKNMMDLDLNVVASNVVEDYNNLESLEMQNLKRKSSFDSSYSNEAIPAMQLLSLMDAGKSSQPFNSNGQKFTTKPLSPCYSQCRSTVTETRSPIVNPHFTYSGMRPGVQNSITNSFSSVFQTGQNVKLTSGHGQQVYYKPQEDKSRGYSRPDDSYTFPLPWHATEDRNKLVNGVFGPAFGPSPSLGTEICTINRNPADFSTPGPDNIYMINVEDLIKSASGNGNGNGPKRQKVNRVN